MKRETDSIQWEKSIPQFLSAPLIIVLMLLFPAWGPDNSGAWTAIAAELEDYTYRIPVSGTENDFWTAPPSARIFKDDPVPGATGDVVKVYAAKNEFEPFQVIIQPAGSGPFPVNMEAFGDGIETEINQVKYIDIETATDGLGRVGDYPDPLWPIEKGASVNLTAGENTAFWITVSVSKTAVAGDYTARFSIGEADIPVQLHVFDFSIPDTLHVKTQMNYSHQIILKKYSVLGTDDDYWMYVDRIKQFFIDHRLTPKGPLWPGGLTSSGGPFIGYDCNGNWNDTDGIWGFEKPAEKYLNGRGFEEGETFNDGIGFPSFMAATFVHNDCALDQRPDRFCGMDRSDGDWYPADNPTSPYNQKWFSYISDLTEYLRRLGYLDRSYYYFANEPNTEEAYDAVAWYSRELKKAAPDLKLMVSEEPRPEIYGNSDYPGAKIDIWLPVLNNYDPEVSHARLRDNGEETWIYFLHGTRPPYFNPITLDHPGIESKLTGWFLWKYRIRGIAYYSLNNWDKNPWTDPMTDGENGNTFLFYPPSTDNQPISFGANNHRLVSSIRLELMRDSLEDYEYLYLLNNSSQPLLDEQTTADIQADKIISGLTSYTRDSQFLYNLRRLIGMKIGGEIPTIPDIEPDPGHPRAQGVPGDYYINFQDPAGEPLADPLTVDGKTYIKIGWNLYDAGLGYGWYGDMAHVMTQYASNAPNPLQASILYDDWGRRKTFEFDLPNGNYNVTVSAGWPGKTYSRNWIEIEGISFISDEATDPFLVRTRPVIVRDKKLTMEMGIFDEYTMLNYMDIKAVQIQGDADCSTDLSLGDVLVILKLLAGFDHPAPEGCDLLRGDFNGNGRVDMADALAILQQISVP